VLDAKGKEPPIVPSNQIQETMEQMMAAQEMKLKPRSAIRIGDILTSRDRIIALQGGAGTGKTTVLRTIREAAELYGYRLQGLAADHQGSSAIGRQ